jgi:hypothetical protein
MEVTYKINGRVVTEAELEASRDPSRLQDILESRCFPGVNTNDTFMAGRKLSGSQFTNEAEFNFYTKRLRDQGGSPAGKYYMHQLAREAGDPEAWVSSAGDVESVARKRGWSVKGAGINVQRSKECLGIEPEYGIADDIVDTELQQTLSKNPEIAPTPKEKARLRAEIKQARQPHYTNDDKPKKKKTPKPIVSLGAKGE